METVQLAIANTPYAEALRESLARGAAWRVLSVDIPDLGLGGVVVVDAQSLDHLPNAIANPERVVLITRKDAPQLARAWEAGIESVVFDNEPLSTALLAIMGARLRIGKSGKLEGTGSGKSAAEPGSSSASKRH